MKLHMKTNICQVDKISKIHAIKKKGCSPAREIARQLFPDGVNEKDKCDNVNPCAQQNCNVYEKVFLLFYSVSNKCITRLQILAHLTKVFFTNHFKVWCNANIIIALREIKLTFKRLNTHLIYIQFQCELASVKASRSKEAIFFQKYKINSSIFIWSNFSIM